MDFTDVIINGKEKDSSGDSRKETLKGTE